VGAGAIVLRPIERADARAFRDCVDTVMRERKYLAFFAAPPLRETAAFVAGNIERGDPHWVAVHRGRIVGWCDVRRAALPAYAHVGLLGMGVRAAYRGRGLGERLLRTVLDASRAAGFEKIELSVYASNARARALYEKVGFVLEGVRVRGRKVDGRYDDVQLMGLFL
jgi:ribosomal protein S18 acetylase RimI-like enzyme